MLPMLAARKRVRAQLGQTRGLMRWADAIASPTEFYTLTCWANQQVMFNFMSSDAHRDMMWLFTKWSDEFWSMRWWPSECEVGDWQGKHFALRGDKSLERRPLSPIPDIALSPRAGPVDPSVCPVTAVLARTDVRDLDVLRRLLHMRRTLKLQTPRLVRWALGSVELNQYLLLTIWEQYDEQVLSSLADSLPGAWLMAWRPGDYEIGHWDGLRLRQLAKRTPSEKAVSSEQ